MIDNKHLVNSLLFLAFFAAATISYGEAPGPCRQAVKLVQRIQDAGPNLPASTRKELYKEAIKLCPAMAEIRYNYGLFLIEEGESGKAREEFLAAKEKEDRTEYRLAIARTYLADAEYGEAEKLYSEVLERDRLNPTALQGLAVIAERSGDVKKASTLLTKALSLHPDDPVAHYNLGAIFEKQKLFDEALVEYEKAIRNDAHHLPSLLHSGLLYLRNGQFAKAAVTLEKAAGISGATEEVFRGLGVAYERMGRLRKAELAFHKALSLDGTDMISRANLGLVLLKMKKPSQVVELFPEGNEKMQSLSPEALLALGLARKNLGEYDQAEKLLRHGYEEASYKKPLAEALVTLFVETGNHAKEEEFRKTLSE